MGFSSIALIGTYFQWLLGIALAAILLRAALIIYTLISSSDENITVGIVKAKVSKYIKAAIICVCVETIVELLKTYFFV